MNCPCSECNCEQQRDSEPQTEVKPFNYIEEAHVTLSDKFYGERVHFDAFENVLMECIRSLHRLDAMKKAMFYGKGMPTEYPDNCVAVPLYVGYDEQTGRNIVHAVLGVATEAGEMLEALYASVIEGKSFDAVNMKEENGDVFWYQAILAKACGFTFEESQRTNIAKLRMRYGEKFSEYDANNRNLKAERSILEADFGNPEKTGA